MILSNYDGKITKKFWRKRGVSYFFNRPFWSVWFSATWLSNWKVRCLCCQKRVSSLLISYLKKGKLRIFLNNTYSKWKKVLFGGLQGSILAFQWFDITSFGFSVSRRKLCGQNTLFCTGLKVSERILANHCCNGSKTIEWRPTQKNTIYLLMKRKAIPK